MKRQPSPVTLAAALALSLAALLAGCVTKSQAEMQAHMAYLAGQRDGLLQAQKQPSRGPTVTLIGPVNTPIVDWKEGLTLRQAIVTAVYTSPTDPSIIIIRRGNQAIPVDTKNLLAGQDVQLQAGDIVEFRQ